MDDALGLLAAQEGGRGRVGDDLLGGIPCHSARGRAPCFLGLSDLLRLALKASQQPPHHRCEVVKQHLAGTQAPVPRKLVPT